MAGGPLNNCRMGAGQGKTKAGLEGGNFQPHPRPPEREEGLEREGDPQWLVI